MQSSTNTINTQVSATYPAGKYYIGDICYALSSVVYELVWGDVHAYKPGTFEVEYQGKKNTFSVNRTKWGDGIYLDKLSGKDYLVDAGVIGIVPFELCKSKNIVNDVIEGGHFIESSSDVIFESNKGIFVISYNTDESHTELIIIDTVHLDSDSDEGSGSECGSDCGCDGEHQCHDCPDCPDCPDCTTCELP
jgi:hypothetical protein